MADRTHIQWTDSTRGRASAAARIGLTWAEYQDHVNRGELWCYRDQAWHEASEFGYDRNRSTGRTASCRRSTNAAARSRYKAKPKPSPGRSFVSARDGDQKQARRRVNHLVDVGVIPNPNTLACLDCAHFGPDRRHEYDHYLGYAAEHHEHVQPVCSACHHARENERRAA